MLASKRAPKGVIGCFYIRFAVAVWCSGNALILINAVAVQRARLVLGWVGKLSHYVTSYPGQLSLAIPAWVDAMSNGYGHR